MFVTLNKRSLLVVTAVAATLLCAGAVHADTIVPGNASFETPVVPTAGYYMLLPGDTAAAPWDAVGQMAFLIDPAIWGSGETGQTGNQFMKMCDNLSSPLSIDQKLGDLVAAVTSYQLTADLAISPSDMSGGATCGSHVNPSLHYKMSLYAYDSGTEISTLIVSQDVDPDLIEAGGGLFATYSTAIATPSQSLVGKQLEIAFELGAGVAAGESMYRLDIDNVFITTGIGEVPEPSAMILASVGLIGLLAYAWRKRR